MQFEKTVPKKRYKKRSKFYLILGIIEIIFGILIYFDIQIFGIILILVGLGGIYVSRNFQKNSIKIGTLEEIENFTSTFKIPGVVEFDNDKKQLTISPEHNPIVVKYSEFSHNELLVNGKPTEKRVNLGGNVNGVIYNDNEALKSNNFRNVTSLKIKLILNNKEKSEVYINLLEATARTTILDYKIAYTSIQKIVQMLQIINNENKRISFEKNDNFFTEVKYSTSIADELSKLHELVEKGILSQEEFDIQKSKLLL